MLIVGPDQMLRLFLLDPVSMTFNEKENVFPSGPALKLSAGDFDNNGFIDVFVTGQIGSSNTNRIFLNNGNLKFTSISDPILDKNLSVQP
jgi:hypothetical protein